MVLEELLTCAVDVWSLGSLFPTDIRISLADSLSTITNSQRSACDIRATYCCSSYARVELYSFVTVQLIPAYRRIFCRYRGGRVHGSSLIYVACSLESKAMSFR